MPDLHARYSAVTIIALVFAFAAAAGLVLPLDQARHLMREGGAVENTTALLFALAIVPVWLSRGSLFDNTAAAASSVLLAACVAREVSLRRLLIDAGQDHFCCSPGFAWSTAVVVVVACVAAALWLAGRYGVLLVQHLRDRRAYAVTLTSAFLLLVVSQLMDRLPKLVATAGIELSPRASVIALSIEELLEMAAPLLLALAVVQARRLRARH